MRRIPTAGIEPELLAPAPRRIRLRQNRWWLSLRILVIGLPVLMMFGFSGLVLWQLFLTLAGTPVTVQVVERGFDASGYRVIVSWPRMSGDGEVQDARRELRFTVAEYFSLKPGRTLPALRVGRGDLQVLDVQTNGRPLGREDCLLTLVLLSPFELAGLAIISGRAGRERRLVNHGRPVRGVVRARLKSDTRSPAYTVLYDYWELGRAGDSVTLHGRRDVTPAQYEQIEVGQGVTIVHSLWNPRRHVAYSLLSRR